MINTLTFSDFLNKFKALTGAKSEQDIAHKLGIKQNTFSMRKKTGEVPYKELINFLIGENVSIDGFLIGEIVKRQAEEYSYIPLYDIRAAAGPGTLIETEEVKDFLAFKQDWIRGVLRVNPNNLRLIYVDGDSMEPTLHHGDLILVNIENHTVVRDGVYVVRFGQAVMVKRLQLLPGGKLKVKSDNEAGYEPFVIDLKKLGEEVAIMGRVVWTGRGL